VPATAYAPQYGARLAGPAIATAIVSGMTRNMTAGNAKPDRPFRVLVLCTGNSARSQIGEALLSAKGSTRAAGRVEAESAGSRPAPRVNPFAVEALGRKGIEWNDRTPKSIDQVAGQEFDLVITVCDNARDACPYFPGAKAKAHWGLPDPADEADADSARRAFADTYDALEARIDALLALPLESMRPEDLASAASAIHLDVDS
jgi:arsenate reductase (thioredoxin)